MRKKPEILAPAGDFVALQAAIQSGADSLYFGVDKLNMRAAAANFALDDVRELSSRCRDAGVCAYLTLNTTVYPGEETTIQDVLDVVWGKVDAVIGWDPSVLMACKLRSIPVHVSTQASVSNATAAGWYKSMGAVRIVPARECTLDELQLIQQQSGLALEVFAHGAMCVSVSGRCYLSDLTHGKSGNRGECQQNCRREYQITDLQDGHEFILGKSYVMSAQDLCTLPFIEMLCDAGMDALKIEGRGRSPEYVRVVVGAYRRAVDAWVAGELSAALKSELMDDIQTVYNRTFCKGFYFGRPIGDFIDAYGGKAAKKKSHVGVVKNYYKKAQAVEILVQNELFDTSTELMIQGATSGVVFFTPAQIRQNDCAVPQANRGLVTLSLKDRVRPGDKVYRMDVQPPEMLHARHTNGY